MYLVNAVLTLNGGLFVDLFRHLILPAIAVGTIPGDHRAHHVRASSRCSDSTTSGPRAKGLAERAVVVRHGLRTALLPVVTVIGLSLGAFLSGAVLTETIFNLTGIGKTILDAVNGRDYIMIQGITLLIAIIYVVVNLLAGHQLRDLDPRVRVS